MGLFREAGRKVEEFKQQIKEASDESVTHQCQSCNEEFRTEPAECPNCGHPEIVLID